MIDTKIIDEFAQKMREALPPGMRDLQEDLDKNLRQIVQSMLSRLDLVTREEFDVQTQVLARTREKVDALEQKLADIELLLSESGAITKLKTHK